MPVPLGGLVEFFSLLSGLFCLTSGAKEGIVGIRVDLIGHESEKTKNCKMGASEVFFAGKTFLRVYCGEKLSKMIALSPAQKAEA